MISTSLSKRAKILLADGIRFEGYAAGGTAIVAGELCFNTAMTGYQETYSDPSYYGQILIATHVHIGNYGVIEGESESERIRIRALICRNLSSHFSRKGAFSLSQWFEQEGVPVVWGVDTRRLVRHIRESGAINAVVATREATWEELEAILRVTPSMEGLQLSSFVSVKDPVDFPAGTERFRVALIDFGYKRNIVRCLNERGCSVRVFPMHVTDEDIMDWKPDGILLSNGPGDPASMPDQVALVRRLCELGVPVFGICLGHQLLALAQGLSTYKMHHGHRGVNHPILNVDTGRGEVTSQNHGFAVREPKEDRLKKKVEITHIHLNDGSVAGLRLIDRSVFSVQYHPEASAGPHDSRYLFDQFVALMAD